MKVLIIAHGHPTLHKGGGEVAAYSLFKMLRADQHQAVFLGWSGHGESADGGPLQKVDENDYLLYTTSEYFHFSSTSSNLKLALALLTQKYDFDVLHLHHYVHIGIEIAALVKSLSPRTRVVLTLHEYLAICANNGQLFTAAGEICRGYSPVRCNECFPSITSNTFFMRELSIKSAFSFVDYFLSPSEFLREQYVQWGIPAEKIDAVENPLPLQYEGEIKALAPPNAERRWKIGFFGQINLYKGLDVLLEGIRLATEQGAECEIGIHGKMSSVDGTSDYLESLDMTIKSLGNRATFHGPYQQADVLRLMESYHFVAMGSRWYENSPVVIQESIAAGRPLIVPALGGMKEKSRGVNIEFAPSDKVSLAKALVNLTGDSYKRLQEKISLRRKEMKTDMKKNYLQTLAVYQR